MADTLIIDPEALRAKHASATFDDQTKLLPLPVASHQPVEPRRAPLGWYDAGDETEIGLPPSRLSFAFLTRPEAEAEPEPALPVNDVPWRRIARRVHEEFSRTPRVVQWVFFALPVIAAVTLLRERDTTPELVESSAIVEPGAASASAPTPVIAPPVAVAAAPKPDPALVRGPSGKAKTLEARAAELVERGNLAEAAALYEKLAVEHPERAVFADAARILRNAARERTEQSR